MSNTKLTCDIANDMLPLYVDEVLSEESKRAVTAHLEKCPKCHQALTDMNAEIDGMPDIPDTDSGLFKRVQKGFRKMYLLRTVIVILTIGILWLAANIYIVNHYEPVNPKAQADYIDECLDVVIIDGTYYLQQTDFFAQGEIVLLSCENEEINFYLGENGIRSLGLVEGGMITPKYQQLINPEAMNGVTKINYCKPDGTVITTLWQTGDAITELKAAN